MPINVGDLIIRQDREEGGYEYVVLALHGEPPPSGLPLRHDQLVVGRVHILADAFEDCVVEITRPDLVPIADPPLTYATVGELRRMRHSA